MTKRISGRLSVLGRRVAVVSAATALGLAVAPIAANASTIMSETRTGWGMSQSDAAAAAKANAYGDLYEAAYALGETCTGITYSNVALIYMVPGGGGFVFTATATGTCS